MEQCWSLLVFCWDYMNHYEMVNPPGMKLNGSPPENFASTPFKSLESPPFCKEVAIERSGRA